MRQGSRSALPPRGQSDAASSIAGSRPGREPVAMKSLIGPRRYPLPQSLQDHVKIGPDAPDVLAEPLALGHTDHVGGLGAQLNVVAGLDTGRPLRQYDDPVGQRYRLLDIMRDQQQGAPALPDQRRRIALDQKLALEVQGGKGLVE